MDMKMKHNTIIYKRSAYEMKAITCLFFYYYFCLILKLVLYQRGIVQSERQNRPTKVEQNNTRYNKQVMISLLLICIFVGILNVFVCMWDCAVMRNK